MKFKIFLFLLFIPALSAQTDLRVKIDSLLNTEFFESSLIAVDVYDLTTDDPLYKLNEKKLLHPASNMKIFTTSAGLVFLGPQYKFRTGLSYSGEIINGTLYGDIYLSGGFDPDFTTEDIDSLAGYVKSAGIKEITGDIIGDVSNIDSLFWGKGWMWDDDPSTDAPYMTSLNVNDNAIGVAAIGTGKGEPAEIKLFPQTGFVNVINKTESVDNIKEADYRITRDWVERKNTIIVEGKVPIVEIKNIEDIIRYRNVFRPELYFLTLFKEYLDTLNIKLDGKLKFDKAPETSREIFTYERSFDSTIVNLNKTSDNLSAEMTLRALSAKYFQLPASADSGLIMIDSLITLSGMDPEVYRIVDGSGVSHYNLVSPELILAVLKYMYSQPGLFRILYESFPVAGVDGTLERRMIGTKAENNVHAKTGTLSGVSCLSGYLTAANDHQLVFSIMVQNYVGSSRRAVEYQNKICEILADYE